MVKAVRFRHTAFNKIKKQKKEDLQNGNIKKLFAKAEKSGRANINGRIIERDFGYVYKGDIESKYRVTLIENVLTLEHWGTQTLKIDTETKKIIEYYGESVSDRDSMNYTLSYFNIDGKFRYFPSKEKFILEI